MANRTNLFLRASGIALLVAMVPATAQAQASSGQQDATAQQDTDRQADQDQAPATTVGQTEQVAQPDTGDIVVTGSRIPRAGFDTPQPAVVVGSELIENRGYTNVADALASQPGFGVPGAAPTGGQAGSFGSGQAFVNYFGLGSQRTLTLVNGRRFVSSNTASIFGPSAAGSQVDLNTIPTKLVDRIETIAVGGAPIYGSDAIAGTVNIILKRDFDGIDLDAQYGISERGDGREYRIRGIVGQNFAGGRGNITVSGEYVNKDGLLGSDRDITREGRFFTSPLDPDSPYRNILIKDRRIPALNQFGAPTVTDTLGFPVSPAQAQGFGVQPSVTNANGQPLAFNAEGELTPIDFGQQTGNTINFSGGNGFSLVPLSNLLSPVERYLGTALGQFQVTDNVRVFGEAWYSHSKGTELRAQPVYNTGVFDTAGAPDGNLIVPLSNPFLSDSARQTIVNSINSNPASDQNAGANQDYFYLGRANTDLVSGLGSSTVELYRFIAGVDGDFQVGGKQFTFEVVGNYGRSETNGKSRELVQQNFLNALNSTVNANGDIVCAPGAENSPIQTLSDTCAPFNPFGNQNSQAVADYITTIARPRSVNTQKVVTASVTGNPVTLPGGDVGFALGYEHREEEASFDAGRFFNGYTDSNGDRQSYGRSVPIDSVSGKFNTDEIFGELRIPITSPDMNIPVLRRVELNGAYRYVDNSLAGGDSTYTLGAEWSPVEDITFRGNYTRSIRAPAITELFNPSSGIFTTADDPCDARFINDGPNPATRAANCQAAGLPGDFESSIVDFTARGTLAGNTDLRNERANSYTVGAVFRPRFVPGLTASVDWISIDLKDAITTLNATQTLTACYDATDYPNNFCGNFTRDADGQITFINTGYANAASREYRGIIAQLAYPLQTPFLGAGSQVNFDVTYQYIDRSRFRVGTGDLTTLRDSIGYSKHQATANVTYSNDNFTWLWQGQYFGPAAIDPDAAENTYEFPRVTDVIFVNSTIGFNVNERFNLRFIVDNVFDQAPPFPSPGGGGTTTYFQGIFGRSYKVGASISF